MNNDKRVQKTLKEINHSFLELAKTKRIDKITVKEICDYANISRSTFYEHFEDLPSYIKRLKTSLVEGYIEASVNYRFDTDTDATMNALIQYLLENKDILFLLFQDEGREGLEIITNSLKEKTIPIWSQESNLNDTQLELLFTYFINGSFAAIEYWCHHKDTIDSEQFKELFENMVKYGVYSYIYTI